MRISARNQIKGKIVDLKKGATTAHVRVGIGGGQIVNRPSQMTLSMNSR